MITLVDTFNNVEISKHRSLINAIKAQRKHLAAVKKANGANSYLTYSFLEDGKPVDQDVVIETECSINNSW